MLVCCRHDVSSDGGAAGAAAKPDKINLAPTSGAKAIITPVMRAGQTIEREEGDAGGREGNEAVEEGGSAARRARETKRYRRRQRRWEETAERKDSAATRRTGQPHRRLPVRCKPDRTLPSQRGLAASVRQRGRRSATVRDRRPCRSWLAKVAGQNALQRRRSACCAVARKLPALDQVRGYRCAIGGQAHHRCRAAATRRRRCRCRRARLARRKTLRIARPSQPALRDAARISSPRATHSLGRPRRLQPLAKFKVGAEQHDNDGELRHGFGASCAHTRANLIRAH